jgi:hypothetical protein
MGAWVAVMLHDHFHHTDSPFYPRTAGVNQAGNVISGGSHGR